MEVSLNKFMSQNGDGELALGLCHRVGKGHWEGFIIIIHYFTVAWPLHDRFYTEATALFFSLELLILD